MRDKKRSIFESSSDQINDLAIAMGWKSFRALFVVDDPVGDEGCIYSIAWRIVYSVIPCGDLYSHTIESW